MLSLKIFTIIDLIAKRVKRQRDIPFGGMQIIFAGDFYQLPPVGDEEEIETTQFCFESPLWNEVFPLTNQIILKTIFRQTDNNYAKILNKLRVGEITKNGIKALEQCVNKKFNDRLNPTILLISSVLNPFITDITIIKTATPRPIPINEKIEITFKKPSFFLAFKNLKVTSFSRVEINFFLFVL